MSKIVVVVRLSWWKRVRVELDAGATLASALLVVPAERQRDRRVLLNGEAAATDQALVHGDVVTLARHVHAESPPRATVKMGGEIWRAHLNDVDPWPSKFHAHSLDDARQVLDLDTGEVFDTETRQPVRKLRPKLLHALATEMRRRLKRP